MNKKGCLITIEGIDGAGKNSQTQKIKKYLESKGEKVKLYSFPQYHTIIGKVIANYLKGEFGDVNSVPRELICISYAADRVSIQQELEKLINEGYFIIIDRYTYSNLFTAAKLPKEQWNSFIDWIEKMEFETLNIRKPDFNFYLYIDPKLSLKRIENRGKRDYQDEKEDIHENNKSLLINTSECYLSFAKDKNDWFVINQMDNEEQLDINSVFEIIKEKLDLILTR